MNVEPNSALLLEFFKNTNSSNLTNREPNSALYERKNNKYNPYNKYNLG